MTLLLIDFQYFVFSFFQIAFVHFIIFFRFLHLASHHIGHRQQSPGGQAVRNSNLRVVIPTPMNSNMQQNEEMSYNDVSVFVFFCQFNTKHSFTI